MIFQKGILLLLAIGLVFPACDSPDVRDLAREPITVKVAVFPYISFAPLFIGKEQGYFSEEGIEVEFVEIGFQNIIPALARGEVDVTSSYLSVGILNAIARGARIRIVADKGYIDSAGCVYHGLVARRTLLEAGELDSLFQLRGKRISMRPETIEGYYMEKLLDKADLTIDDIETVNVPSPAVELELMEKGLIDLTAVSEPWVTRIAQSGQGMIWKPLSEVLPDFQFSFILYGPALLDKNPEAGKRFMCAYLKAVKFYNRGKTKRNVWLLSKYTKVEQELLHDACWQSIRNDGQINIDSVLDFQAWAMKKGFIDNPITKDQFWDPSFIEYANRILNIPPP